MLKCNYRHQLSLLIFAASFWGWSSYAVAAPTIQTIAGNGSTGFSGDGGPATAATLNFPSGVAVSAGGFIYFADDKNTRIRKIDPSGNIATVAGNGIPGFSGDGGLATSAELGFNPSNIAVDATGNLYIADASNQRIRKVNTSGIITTIAGDGTVDFIGENGVPATSVGLDTPNGVAVDSVGNVYIADSNSNRIRKVDTSGIITTFAGNATPGISIAGFSGDGGPATSAQLNSPYNVFVDAAGNLYITDAGNYRIRKVDTAGIISTVAGTGTVGFSGDGGPATSAQLSNVLSEVSSDGAGNLYIADAFNNRIRMVNPSGTITTVAGTGTIGFSGDGGPAALAQLSSPSGVAVDAGGNYYIGDTLNNRIRKVTSAAVPVITSTTSAIGNVNSFLSYQIVATNSPTSFAATNLPPGLTVNSLTGLISGTPSAQGSYTVTLSATNSNGSGTASLSLMIRSTNCEPSGGSAVDVQQEIWQAVGALPCVNDINQDGICNIVDVQRVNNAVITSLSGSGPGCVVGPLVTTPQTAPSLALGTASGAAGTTISLPVNFNTGTASVAGIQFSVTLPPGISTGTILPGIVSAPPGSGGPGKVWQQNFSGNTWTFVIMGPFNQTTINSGTLLTVQLNIAPATPSGNLTVPLSGVAYTDPNAASMPAGPNSNGTITVTALPPPPPGSSPCDVNGDGLVNVVDVQAEVDMVLKLKPCTNYSGSCTILSVQRVVNAVLNGTCPLPL